jgi:hypothetical protein
MVASFIFDPSKGETPQMLARQRAIIQSLARAAHGGSSDVGEGLSNLGSAIAYRIASARADRAEKAGMESAAADWGPIAGMFGGGAEAAGIETGGTIGRPPVDPNVADGPKGQESYPLAAGGGEIEAYIRQAAAARGIDPDIAVRVAQSEGGLKDPYRQGEAMLKYGREESYGPFQLHMRMGGVGERALAEGIDPRKDWKRGVDYGLNEAAQKGWGQWFGAAKAGIGNRQGLEKARAIALQQAAAAGGGSPVQVASLDPNAGMAKAVQDGSILPPAASGNLPPAQDDPVIQALTGGKPVKMAGDFPAAPDPNDAVIQQLMKAAQNPWLNDGQQAVVKALLGEELKKRDPSYALEQEKTRLGLEKDRVELDRLLNPVLSPYEAAQVERNKLLDAAASDKARQEQADREADNARDDKRLGLDVSKFDYEKQKDALPEYYDAYVKQEQAAGRQPLGILEFITTTGKAKANNITVGGNSSKFAEESDKAAATRLNDIITAGNEAPKFMADIQTLAELGPLIGTGKEAQVKAALGPYAQALGFDIEGLGESQAYGSIVSRLAPQMRPAGSGAASDFDARQFLNSLPSLGNTPDGNLIITSTFDALGKHKMAAAEIASMAMLPPDQGGITWQEAEKQIRALPNPYEGFNAWRKGKQQPAAPDASGKAAPPAANDDVAPEGIDPELWKFVAPEDRKAWSR